MSFDTSAMLFAKHGTSNSISILQSDATTCKLANHPTSYI